MEELQILGPCTSTMWSFIQFREDKEKRIRKYDVDLCDGARKSMCENQGTLISSFRKYFYN